MFNFFGFSAKYCIPSNIAGKVLNKAKIFYENDWVCEYNYNRKKNEIRFGFLNNDVEEALKGIVRETGKKFGTPQEFPEFIMAMFGYLEMQHHLKELTKKGYTGIVAVIKEDCTIERLIPIEEFSSELLDKISESFPTCKCIFVSSKDEFDVKELLEKDKEILSV